MANTVTVKIYQDSQKERRWSIKARNGEVIGASSEGFSSKQYCGENLKLLILDSYDYLVSEGIVK